MGERRYAEKARTLVMDDLAYLRKHIPYMVNIWILSEPGTCCLGDARL